jgi:hypothetical protein
MLESCCVQCLCKKGVMLQGRFHEDLFSLYFEIES